MSSLSLLIPSHSTSKSNVTTYTLNLLSSAGAVSNVDWTLNKRYTDFKSLYVKLLKNSEIANGKTMKEYDFPGTGETADARTKSFEKWLIALINERKYEFSGIGPELMGFFEVKRYLGGSPTGSPSSSPPPSPKYRPSKPEVPVKDLSLYPPLPIFPSPVTYLMMPPVNILILSILTVLLLAETASRDKLLREIVATAVSALIVSENVYLNHLSKCKLIAEMGFVSIVNKYTSDLYPRATPVDNAWFTVIMISLTASVGVVAILNVIVVVVRVIRSGDKGVGEGINKRLGDLID